MNLKEIIELANEKLIPLEVEDIPFKTDEEYEEVLENAETMSDKSYLKTSNDIVKSTMIRI